MTYDLEIERLVSYKHKLEAENAKLRAALEECLIANNAKEMHILERQRENYPALYLQIGNALSDEILTMGNDDIERRFKGLLGSSRGCGVQQTYAKAVRSWIAFEAFED